ncbi:hypothetical protein NDU88_003070 [Pleurodeles waltl]|uniref:Uncharacterized protein n=1 Tax=Pleurodeles waltl TaxID=8319 RepID=A0AAV7QEQ7_PLEWA|nr:hypothetical protein NDU88_003070 [Pleurodeles waltl]
MQTAENGEEVSTRNMSILRDFGSVPVTQELNQGVQRRLGTHREWSILPLRCSGQRPLSLRENVTSGTSAQRLPVQLVAVATVRPASQAHRVAIGCRRHRHPEPTPWPNQKSDNPNQGGRPTPEKGASAAPTDSLPDLPVSDIFPGSNPLLPFMYSAHVFPSKENADVFSDDIGQDCGRRPTQFSTA